MKKFAAVIGYGGMGGWHTRYMLNSDVCALAGVYDIDPQKNALAEERGIHAYASEAELLADPEVNQPHLGRHARVVHQHVDAPIALPDEAHEGGSILP